MKLEARTAVLEWALRAGRGELPGTDWVDAELRSHGEPFAIVRDGDQVRFRHLPLTDTLPPALAEAAQEAQLRGEPTALEALTVLLARAQWLTSCRPWVWTPFSPVPELLAALVESYGIDVSLHQGEPEALANLLVHLPSWHPYRGDAEAGRELLSAALDLELPARLTSDAEACFTCQDAAWWSRHGTPTLRIQGGFLRAGPARDREDVVLGWIPRDRFPHEFLRLLPASATVRLAVEEAPR